MITLHAFEEVAFHIEVFTINFDRPDWFFRLYLRLRLLILTLLVPLVKAHFQLFLIFNPGVLRQFDQRVNNIVSPQALFASCTRSVQLIHGVDGFALLALPLVLLKKLVMLFNLSLETSTFLFIKSSLP